MCDYSLHTVASRPAKVGDKLVSTRFSNSITRGFAAAGEADVAVCLLPGTEIAFEQPAEYEHGWDIFFRRKIDQRVARFRQVEIGRPDVHHDALEFPNGQVVLVTQLREGQSLTVLQLPAAAHAEAGEPRAMTAAARPRREPADT